MMASNAQAKVLFTFEDDGQLRYWYPMNDGVMGGLSESRLLISQDGTGLFEGIVSLENFGGFASVRTHPIAYGLEGYQGIVMRVKGDGKRYKLRIRTDAAYDGPAYEAAFATEAQEWTLIWLPFSSFHPVFRGRPVRGMPKLEGKDVQQIGLMISDKQAGLFRLEMDWIGAYRDVAETA
jgi:monofunctional biosynthetic peptidoglycan transglycosylase